jgi:hypothetical protein
VAIGEHLAVIPRQVGKTGLTLLLPQDHAPAWTCTVPVTLDSVCGATFSKHERSGYEAHVQACIRANVDVIRAASPSIRRDVLGPGIWDRDLAKFMEKHADAIREGRKTI